MDHPRVAVTVAQKASVGSVAPSGGAGLVDGFGSNTMVATFNGSKALPLLLYIMVVAEPG